MADVLHARRRIEQCVSDSCGDRFTRASPAPKGSSPRLSIIITSTLAPEQILIGIFSQPLLSIGSKVPPHIMSNSKPARTLPPCFLSPAASTTSPASATTTALLINISDPSLTVSSTQLRYTSLNYNSARRLYHDLPSGRASLQSIFRAVFITS